MTLVAGAIVRCHDEGRAVEPAIAWLRAVNRGALEIVIADCDSQAPYTRSVLARVRRHVSVVRGGSEAAACNRAADEIHGDYLCIIDPGAVDSALEVERALAILAGDPDTAFVSLSAPEVTLGGVQPWRWTWLDALGAGIVPVEPVLLRRSLWRTLGGLDESLGRLAWLDLWIRALHGGARGLVAAGPRAEYRPISAPDVTAWGRVYAKHAALVAFAGEPLLQRKQRALDECRQAAAELDVRTRAFAAELGPLQDEVNDLGRELSAAGLARVDWGDLARDAPLSPFWGSDRGAPVNRHYIGRFLERHRADVTGRVLEVKDDGYAHAYGTGVEHVTVLDVDPDNPDATLVADLSRAEGIPSEAFDCVILTQVLNVVFDVRAALGHVYRILRPGGVLLCTVAALDRVSYEGAAVDGDYWRFTEASLRALLADWPVDCVEVSTHGNVRACTAHLYGLAAGELTDADLDHTDPAFPLIVTARARKPGRETC